METSIWLYVLLIGCIVMSAFFSASETAYSSMNRVRMKNYAKTGNKKAIRAIAIADDFDRALSAILIGNNVVNITSASIGTVIFTALLGPGGVPIATFVMTVLVLIFGEILPKSYAKDHAENFALRVSGLLSFLMKILYPVVSLFVLLKKAVTRKNDGEDDNPSVTEEELKYIIEEIEDEGVLEKQESELLQSALEFNEITAEEILIPRVDVAAVDIEDDPEEIKQIFLNDRYSRIPVYEESIDNIIGIVHQKNVLMALSQGKPVDLRSMLKQPLFVPPSKKISVLLKELQKTKSHMAIVTDQYGGTVGIVTLEDILEELVGEIWDEHDVVTEEFVALPGRKYEVSGSMNIYDMFEQMEVDPEGIEINSNSVSGWVMDNLGKVPDQGDIFAVQNLKVTVQKAEEQRVVKVLVELL